MNLFKMDFKKSKKIKERGTISKVYNNSGKDETCAQTMKYGLNATMQVLGSGSHLLVF